MQETSENLSLDSEMIIRSFQNQLEDTLEENKKHFPFLNEPEAYKNYASDIEKLWRLEFGHPILCRH